MALLEHELLRLTALISCAFLRLSRSLTIFRACTGAFSSFLCLLSLCCRSWFDILYHQLLYLLFTLNGQYVQTQENCSFPFANAAWKNQRYATRDRKGRTWRHIYLGTVWEPGVSEMAADNNRGDEKHRRWRAVVLLAEPWSTPELVYGIRGEGKETQAHEVCLQSLAFGRGSHGQDVWISLVSLKPTDSWRINE